MDNKEKCRYLKKIRKNIADKLGIDLQQRDCAFEGECSGTCPKCQQEERALNTALLKKGMALAGAVAVTASLAACTPVGNDLSGDVEQAPPAVEKQDPGSEELSGEVDFVGPPKPEDPEGHPVTLDGDMVVPEDMQE